MEHAEKSKAQQKKLDEMPDYDLISESNQVPKGKRTILPKYIPLSTPGGSQWMKKEKKHW